MCRCLWQWHCQEERSNLAISTETFSLSSQLKRETRLSTFKATLVAANPLKKCMWLPSLAQDQSTCLNSSSSVSKTGKKFKTRKKRTKYLSMRRAMKSWWTWSITRTVSSISSCSTSMNTSQSTQERKSSIRKKTRLRQLRKLRLTPLW